MKKNGLFILLLFLCLLLGCSSTIPDGPQPSSTDTLSTIPSLQMPNEIKKFANNPKVEWVAGLLAVIDDAELIRSISHDSFEVFTDPGDVYRATITVQNGLNKTQHFELLVFADGVPVEFKVEEELYTSYPIALTPEQKTIIIEFDKKFELNLGRLDFVMSYSENSQEEFHLVCHSFWIQRNDEPLIPSSLCTTIEQRKGIQGKYTGNAYDAWIWDEGTMPTTTNAAGPRKVNLQEGETILLEAVASKPGLYRTVLVVGENPVDFEWNGTQYSYIDWESTGTNMLQLPIQLTDVPPSGSIYTISTPLNKDAMAQPIRASCRIELSASGAE